MDIHLLLLMSFETQSPELKFFQYIQPTNNICMHLCAWCVSLRTKLLKICHFQGQEHSERKIHCKSLLHIRTEFFTAVRIHTVIFSVMTPKSLVGGHQWFRGTSIPDLKTLIPTYHTTRKTNFFTL